MVVVLVVVGCYAYNQAPAAPKIKRNLNIRLTRVHANFSTLQVNGSSSGAAPRCAALIQLACHRSRVSGSLLTSA